MILPDPRLLDHTAAIARAAGELIMEYYENGDAQVTRKDDASPVTDADHAADIFIRKALESWLPRIPVVSEEGADNLSPGEVTEGYVWLVDPLDGTKGFLRGTGEFTVNIGLVHDREPVAGVLYVPVQGTLYAGIAATGRAWKETGNGKRAAIRTRRSMDEQPGSASRITALVSAHHPDAATEAFLMDYGVAERMQASSALKFCLLAEGKADIYPRFGPTMEWDTAAGHAIVLAAGGAMSLPDGQPFRYAKEGYYNREGFVAAADAALIGEPG